MAVFSEPTKWAQALGATANADVIPDEAGAMDVDISKIFPAVFSVPLAQGGKAIPRRTLNGILKLLGDWLFYYQQGGIPSYSKSIDYAVGREVLYNGGLYKCIQDNTHTAPHKPTDKNYWAELSDSVDIDNIATDLNGKADRSLSNVDNTANILMAHNAMPSNVYNNLTLGASGSQYTAPADGYVLLNKISSNINQQVTIHTTTMDAMTISPASGVALVVWLPVFKGEKFTVNYDTGGATFYFRFVYAIGSKSQKA